MIATILLIACSSTPDIDIPLSDDSPTLLVFCNNTDVPCINISSSVSPYLTEQYGEDTITQAYFFIDSSMGARIFEQLQLSSLPSYVIFDSDQTEIFRHEGDIDLEQIDGIFSQLLSG
ncbi:MAG: hypothetical protein Phog2KO_47580 [Phototrophicaceae bacterium]